MSGFSNLSSQRIFVGDTEVAAFHIPVDRDEEDEAEDQVREVGPRIRIATSPQHHTQSAAAAGPFTPQNVYNGNTTPSAAATASASKYFIPPRSLPSPVNAVGPTPTTPHAMIVNATPPTRFHAPLVAHPPPTSTPMTGNANPLTAGGINIHIPQTVHGSRSNSPVMSSVPMMVQPSTAPLASSSAGMRMRPSITVQATRPAPTPTPTITMVEPFSAPPALAAASSSSSPSPNPPTPAPASSSATSSSSSASPAANASKRPLVNRTSSFTDPKTMADMGLLPPVIQRLASVDATAVANMQKAREAAKPDVAKAERYRNLTCPRMRDTSKGTYSLYSIWKFTDRQFIQYGLGVMLWFKLSRRLSYLFFVLTLITLPSLIFNLVGPDSDSIQWYVTQAAAIAAASNGTSAQSDPMSRTGVVDGTYGLSHTTLAHQGLVLNATIFGYSKQEIGAITGGLDTFATIVYLFTILWIFHDHAKESTRYNSTVMTVRRFTVLVTNLPDTRPILGRLAIADFFQKKFGPVVDVSIAYNDIQLIELFKQRGDWKREMQSAELQDHLEQRDELGKKLAQLDHTIAFKKRVHRKMIRAAFVTFQTQESVTKCLASYPNSWWSRVFMPNELRFHDRPLKVTRAAEPSNTLFQNLGLTYGDQWCRRAWTGLVSLTFMSVSFVAVFVSQYYQNQIPTTAACATSIVVKKEYVTDEQSKFCYCAGLSAEELYDDSSFCSTFIAQYALAKGLIFVTALSTVLVNFLLQLFMDRLAVLERHSSLTSQQRGVTSRLFWGLFFNTGVIILIVNADLSSYVGGVLSHLLPGQYYELSPDWFYEVGVSILITMFLNSQNPHILSLMAIPYDSCRRSKCRRFRKNQNELNELYQGRKFVLYERYSVLINTVFVCMMYSAGMPILWPTAGITFLCTYWFDKITFLRNYRIPPRYDESLDEYASNILPYAVVPHLLMTLWFFTSPMTNSFPLGDMVPLVPDGDSFSAFRTAEIDLKDRFFQWNTFPTLLLLFLLVALWTMKKILAIIFFCRASEAEKRALRIGTEEKKSKSLSVTYQDACAKIGLESYRLSRQHEYRSAYIATESKKQLPAELDLYQLREVADAKHSGGERIKKKKSKKKTTTDVPLPPPPPTAPQPSSSPAAKKYAVAASDPPPTAPPTPPTEAWVAPPNRAPSAELPSETRSPPGTAPPSISIQQAGPEYSDAYVSSTSFNTQPVASADPSHNPVAAINHMSDAVTLTMAAAVADSALSADSLGYTLLPISCPSCSNLFQIVDCGEAMSYTCPFCQAQTII